MSAVLTSYADIAQSVVRHVVDHLVEVFLGHITLPQPVEPCQLEHLLGKEESSDEIRVGREERNVAIVNVHHVWTGENAILLECKVKGE